MNGDAIEIVTRAIETVLEEAFTALAIAGGVFVGPLDDPAAEGAAAVLFLHRIAINPDLRNSEHAVQAPVEGDPPIVRTGGLPLDLHFLLTGGMSSPGEKLESLRVLGNAMQVLNDTPFLVGVPVQGETIRLSLEPLTSEEMSRIWTLFPTANFRTSVGYLVSPVWIDPAIARPAGPPVVREPHRVGHIAR